MRLIRRQSMSQGGTPNPWVWFLVLALECLGLTPVLASPSQDGTARTLEVATVSSEVPLPGAPDFNAASLAWRQVKLGEPDFRRANDTQIVRLQIPEFPAEEVVLQWNYTHPQNQDGLGSRAFLAEGESFRELKALDARFASYILSRDSYGKQLYLVLKHPSYSISVLYTIKIEERSQFHRTQEWNHFIVGIILGTVGIIALFNLWIFVHFRQEYSLWHFTYCLSMLVINASANGLIEINDTNMILIFTAMMGWMVSLVLFSLSFFHTKSSDPKSYRVGKVFLVFGLLIFLGFLSRVDLIAKNFVYTTPLFMGYCLYLAIRSAIRGFRPAYVILIGWSALALSFLIVSIQVTWNLPLELGWASPFAVIIEISCFTFAINRQIKLTELLYQSQIEHAFAEMSKIVYKHQVERIKIGHSIETTMPTFDAKAYVLSFDIIRSSQIQNPIAKELFRQVFLRCNSLMSEGYDENSLSARAYRIKEVGDGFLCSIGYPFVSLTSRPADEAVELAKACINVLSEESSRLLPDSKPVCCGLGIAFGDISGFYPPSGAKEYDLFGRSIVHATRYESMRKYLFQNLEDKSVLIIQDLVYEKLSPALQEGFTRFDLREAGLKVRDDDRATSLYFQLF